jgi:chromosomal replication initiation ATPase DnaA
MPLATLDAKERAFIAKRRIKRPRTVHLRVLSAPVYLAMPTSAILSACVEYFHMDESALTAARCDAFNTRPIQIAMYLHYEHCGRNYETTAKVFNRNRGTVPPAWRAVNRRKKSNATLRRWIGEIERLLAPAGCEAVREKHTNQKEIL